MTIRLSKNNFPAVQSITLTRQIITSADYLPLAFFVTSSTFEVYFNQFIIWSDEPC